MAAKLFDSAVFDSVIFDTSPSAGGVTGTVSVTTANDTSNASGTTTVTGTSSVTTGNDTPTASGSTTLLGTASVTTSDDSATASGSVGGGSVDGTVSVTTADDVSSANGSSTIVGIANVTTSSDTSTANGSTTITGLADVTTADDISTASGNAGAITGTVNVTTGNDTPNATGTTPQETLFGGVAHFEKLAKRSQKLREIESQERTEAPTREDIAEVIQIPQEVKEVIANVAKIDNETIQRQQLKAQLKALEIQFKQEYADALKTEMIRQYLIMELEQQEEEETIAMIMMALV